MEWRWNDKKVHSNIIINNGLRAKASGARESQLATHWSKRAREGEGEIARKTQQTMENLPQKRERRAWCRVVCHCWHYGSRCCCLRRVVKLNFVACGKYMETHALPPKNFAVKSSCTDSNETLARATSSGQKNNAKVIVCKVFKRFKLNLCVFFLCSVHWDWSCVHISSWKERKESQGVECWYEEKKNERISLVMAVMQSHANSSAIWWRQWHVRGVISLQRQTPVPCPWQNVLWKVFNRDFDVRFRFGNRPTLNFPRNSHRIKLILW